MTESEKTLRERLDKSRKKWIEARDTHLDRLEAEVVRLSGVLSEATARHRKDIELFVARAERVRQLEDAIRAFLAAAESDLCSEKRDALAAALDDSASSNQADGVGN